MFLAGVHFNSNIFEISGLSGVMRSRLSGVLIVAVIIPYRDNVHKAENVLS